MKVLLTRPAAPSNDLVQALRKAGDEVSSCPALVIAARAPSTAQRANVPFANCFVFVSAHAVRYGWGFVESRAADHDVQWCAVGPTTAALVSAHGVSVVAPVAPGSSDALLELDALQSVREKRFVIVRGVGGVDPIRVVLEARGARVDVLEVYERKSADVATLARALATGVDVVVVSSGDGLDAIVSALIQGRLQQTMASVTFVVPSERVAAQARVTGVARILVSAGASDAAVAAALQNLRAENG